MARRKKDEGWFNLFFWVFTKFSAWLCIPAAFLAFIAVNVILQIAASIHPITKGLVQLGPLAGGIFAGLVLLAGLKAGIEKGVRKKLFDKQTSIESIRELSWSQFELLIGEAYRRAGYEVSETGGGGADGGIDLRLRSNSETVLVQCKQWKVYKVGVKPIRELYGVLMAERADRAIFVTSGVYTKEARDFASGKPLELIDGDALSRLVTSVSPQDAIHDLRAQTIDDQPEDQESPACPVCRGSMALRTARKGDNAGSQFWGCSAYPKCRGTRQLG
jgi:restriction system protein